MTLQVIHLHSDPSLDHLTDKEYMLLPPGKWNTGGVCMMLKRTEGPNGRFKKLGFVTHDSEGKLDPTIYFFGCLPTQPDDPTITGLDFDKLPVGKEKLPCIKFNDVDAILADGWEVD